MKKVTNVTLGRSVFVIEDDAYEKLSAYLTDVEHSFGENDEVSDIMLDIEIAIAEKLHAFGKNDKNAVSIEDVSLVIAEMGNTEEIHEGTSGNTTQKTEEPEQRRRFYRDTDEAILGGVASGIARYFDIDPVLVRLAFVLFAIFGDGIGLIAYIILWLIVPPAETTSQKFAMRGERMTLSEIREHVRKKIHTTDTPEQVAHATSGMWSKVRKPLHTLFSLLGTILRHGARFFTLALAFACILLGSFGIATLISVTSILWMGKVGWLPLEIQQITSLLMHDVSGNILLIALITSVLIPLITLLMLGASVLSGKNHFTASNSIPLGIMWILALTFVMTLAIAIGPNIQEELGFNGNRGERSIIIREMRW